MDHLGGWRVWIAPGVVVAIAVGGFTYLESRFASVDRRFDTLAAEVAGQRERGDRIIESVAAIQSGVAGVKAEISLVANKVDRIATKLDVASAPTETYPAALGRDSDGSHMVPAGSDKEDTSAPSPYRNALP